MQNTSLPVFSSLTSASSKPSNMGASNAPKTASTDNAQASNSFQKTLANQVQQRQQKADAQQGKSATTNSKATQNQQQADANAADSSVADAKAGDASKNAGKDIVDPAAVSELADQFKDLGLLAKQEKELKAKSGKSEDSLVDKSKDGKDGKASTDATTVLTTDPAIAALAVPANVPVTPTDKPALSTEAEAAEKPQADIADSRPRGRLDQELGNMLAQSRSDSTETSQLAQAGDDKADMSAWLEKMLPGFNTGDKAKLTEQAPKVDNSATITQAQAAAASAATNLTPVQASAAVGSSNTISAYPGRAGWDQAIGQKVSWMVAGGEQSATLTLNPPDMGPLQVVIHVHNDVADATFMSNNQEVRQALEDGMSNLRDMLNASGIQLGQSNVGEHTQSQQQLAESGGRNGSARGTAGNEADGAALAPTQQTIVRSGNGMVDTFV